MTLYRNKFRVESARLKHWDYSTPGFYFVTICTRGREHYLGRVCDGVLKHSPAGEIVADEWMNTETVRANVKMHAWVVMPDHVHGIVQITHRIENDNAAETLRRNVSTNPARLKPNSLGSIIGQIKIRCTKRIRASGVTEFDWQERFWDEILWDDKAFSNVRTYIENNPANWERDQTNPAGIRM